VASFVARGAGQQTYLFYGPILRALSSLRMTLLIGANHVVRVSALRDIGWYQGHLTEDLPDHSTTSGGTMTVRSVAVYDGTQG